MGPSTGDTIVWYRVTRYPQVFRGLTVGQRTLEFWGVTMVFIMVNIPETKLYTCGLIDTRSKIKIFKSFLLKEW